MGFAFFFPNLNSNDLGCDSYCKAVYLDNKTHASLRKWICGTEKCKLKPRVKNGQIGSSLSERLYKEVKLGSRK